MAIYIFCPETDSPVGAVKGYYRYVDILNRNGFPAYILHQTMGFRCTWFKNETKIAYTLNSPLAEPHHGFIGRLRNLISTKPHYEDIRLIGATSDKIMETDYIIIPAIYSKRLSTYARGTKRVIFNRGCYYIFGREALDNQEFISHYRNKDILAVFVVSEDNLKYIKYSFPSVNVFRHHNSINPSIFYYTESKKKQICLMTRRRRQDVSQVINILRSRQNLSDFTFVLIEGECEEQVAKIMRDSLIFLSFSEAEGCPNPPAEAMACGCMVVGYHGQGGKEYFNPEYCYPVEMGDIICFVQTIEHVVDTYRNDPVSFFTKTRKASNFVNKHYSPEVEERDVVEFWTQVTKGTGSL